VQVAVAVRGTPAGTTTCTPRRMRVEHHDWHTVRADWLKANGLKGALTELRAMVWPHIGRGLGNSCLSGGAGHSR
jgi:hypothetical protein